MQYLKTEIQLEKHNSAKKKASTYITNVMSWDRQTLSALNRWVKRTEGTLQNNNFRQVVKYILQI